ncbi:MAG: 2-oxoacid:ferredoxin oxidoreductase subunit beta [Magnetococcales bacterium]|nr:2-oxoacid:ferredoxin oxidoreductase subunit beta [Magnetococcales bacterium]NGZ27789.1 2-oxoacid:ferredoxin oxidoreductase subunit beta [Magnetococcales bacterium]
MSSPYMHATEMKPKDYKSDVSVVWCPGCGHHGILNGVYRALAEAGVDPTGLICVSGIGCSSRLPYFLQSYKMHTLHGRAAPVATGAAVVRPDLVNMISGGDGDGFAIGGGHMPHVARKNVNLTYVLMDNGIYGLTKGQYSPTSRPELKAYTTPYGGPEEPMNPMLYMLTYGATYVAQAFAGKPGLCADLIKGALEHKGFSYVHIFTQCPSYNKIDTIEFYRDLVTEIPEGHDTSDLGAAMELARRPGGKAPIGLFYKVDRPTLNDHLDEIVTKVGGHKDYDIQKVINLSRP